jgi:hypothetical protein
MKKDPPKDPVAAESDARPPVKFSDQALMLYDDSVKAIVACTTLIKVKYHADRADALKALAQIKKDKRLEIEARQLKLIAYRQAGQLAEELRPTVRGRGFKTVRRGSLPGAQSLLEESGFNHGEAIAALHLRRAPQKTFDALLETPRPPTPLVASQTFLRDMSKSWAIIRSGSGPIGFRSFCRKHEPKGLARGLASDEADEAAKIAREISDWLDAFEHHLPKYLPKGEA